MTRNETGAAGRPEPSIRRGLRAWLRPRNFFLALVAAILVWIGGAKVYEAWIGAAQDRCSFGPVSNARYQEWLTKAKALRQREGDLISLRVVLIEPERKSYQNVTDILFDELSRGITSVEERIAIAHAMMRADGFNLLSIDPDLQDPYAAAGWRVGFKYGKYSLPGLLLLCQFDCMNRAYASLYLRNLNQTPYPGDRHRRNQFGFSYSPGPELISLTRYYVPPPQHPHTCPPIPPPEWAAQLIASTDIR